MTTSRDAIVGAWALSALERMDIDGTSLAAHPAEILGEPVAERDALDLARVAFDCLVSSPKRRAGDAYLVVSVGTVSTAPDGLAKKAVEVESSGIETFIRNQLDVAVGVAPSNAQWQSVEVITVPLAATVFGVRADANDAFVRGMRYPDDPDWSADAVLRHRWS